MHMVRRGDNDGVDVIAREEVAILPVGVAAAVIAGAILLGVSILHALLAFLEAAGFYIAQRDNLDVLLAQVAAEMALAHLAQADESQVDAFTGRRGAEGRGGNDMWKRHGGPPSRPRRAS